jgi:hypothetical protein
MTKIYEFNLFRRGTEGDDEETECMRVATEGRSDVEALRHIREDYFEDEWGLIIGRTDKGFVSAGPLAMAEEDEEEWG